MITEFRWLIDTALQLQSSEAAGVDAQDVPNDSESCLAIAGTLRNDSAFIVGRAGEEMQSNGVNQ
jgi:hypothetical protein